MMFVDSYFISGFSMSISVRSMILRVLTFFGLGEAGNSWPFLKRSFRDFLFILAVCILGISLHSLIIEGNFNPLSWIVGGVYFSAFVSYTFLPIPSVFFLYAIYAFCLRLCKSRYLYFVCSWAVVIANNFHNIQLAREGGFATSTVRNGGYERFYEGGITPFGFLSLNLRAELLLAVLATIIILSPKVARLFLQKE